MKRILVVLALLAGCGEAGAPSAGPAEKKIRVAYVTNGVDPFWNVAAAGAKAGEKEFKVELEVLMPPKGLPDQKRMLETLLVRGVEGIAVSPVDATNQVDQLNEACAKTNLITHDSDAPESKRLCFVGMDNYRAGRACGKLVKEVLPDGGKVMIFVGRMEQLNAQQRRQGVIDELAGRPEQSLDKLTYDPPGAEVKGDKFTILGTRTDNFDYAKAKSNAEDAMTAHPDLACMIGLFAYNTPMCFEAVKGAGKLGKVKLAGFDEQDAMLQGIADGHIHGTVSQQPYKYGYESVRILAALARGDRSVLPAGGFLEVPIVTVRKDNVQAFWTELKKLRAGN
jgi:ribose transport system substrate-binding protein